MTMWLLIMWTALALTGLGLVYLSTRVCRFKIIKKLTENNENRKTVICGGIVFGLFIIVGIFLNFINAVICVINFTLIWFFIDLCFYIFEKIRGRKFVKYYSGYLAVIIGLSVLIGGWYADHNVWKTEYTLYTDKNIDNLKVLMFADSHIGTTFDAKGFAKHIKAMQKTNPDVVFIVGDYVDDDTTKEDMIEATAILGKLRTKYGIYFVFGNHDKGYYGPAYRGFSAGELVNELQKNGINVLQDEIVTINDMYYIIGRKDLSESKEHRGNRLSMDEMVNGLNKSKYMIVLDHQPSDYINQANSEVDLVVSGHTHGGQMFPFNQVGKWLKVNDNVYGYEKRKDTDFIVTSGISDWAIKFKTGTKSEFVVINIKKS